MRTSLTTRARAKVNLTLSVRGRRADGYHDLESLVAFAGIGDTLTLEPGLELGLTISGPKGQGLETDERNLVLRAARALAEELGPLRWGRFHLVKRLPVASGVGGGSADAAAALRLMARQNGLSLADPVLQRVALSVGADVPVCLESRARVMAGIGDRLGPALRLPPLFAVLVNPGVPVATMDIFRKLGLALGKVRPYEATDWQARAMDRDGLITALRFSANDLEAPAKRVAPVLEPLLQRLTALPDCRLARMSGSGATCLALFDDCRASAAAAKSLSWAEPGWWVKATMLR